MWDVTWSLRRAVGGAFAAGVGWEVALAFTRVVFPGMDLSLPQPLFYAIAGLFIGAAGGLMERSTRLAARGMALGGGAGLLLGFVLRSLAGPGGESSLFWVQTLTWAGTGLLLGWFVGRVRSWDGLGGALGGGLGGALSLNFSVAMSLQFESPGWPTARGIEFLAGAILGAFLWGGMALTGRLGLRHRWLPLSSRRGS